jgi:hypothetical protein
MARFQLIIFTNAKPGRDAEYNDWYDKVHMDDLLAMDGVVAGQRFRTRGESRWRYGSVFELECEDPNALAAEMARRCLTGEMSFSDAVDLETVQVTVLEPNGERHVASVRSRATGTQLPQNKSLSAR